VGSSVEYILPWRRIVRIPIAPVIKANQAVQMPMKLAARPWPGNQYSHHMGQLCVQVSVSNALPRYDFILTGASGVNI